MRNKAVFLDRDGVINEVLSERVKFVNRPEQLFLLENVGKAVKQLNEAGYLVFVVTNQGGVGLGYMKEKTLHDIHKKMIAEIKKDGGIIQEVAYCAHRPHAGCACRKPEPKLIIDLAKKYNVDLEQSFMIGDRDVDIEAGKKAGAKTILIGDEQNTRADGCYNNLYEAVQHIISLT